MEKNKSEAIEKALNEYIRQIASDLDLTPKEIIEALKDALVSAIRKELDTCHGHKPKSPWSPDTGDG